MANPSADPGALDSRQERREAQRWELRRSRAQQLADVHFAASEPLRFYAALAVLQGGLVETHASAIRPGTTFDELLDYDAVAETAPQFVTALAPIAPPRLAAALSGMADDRSVWRAAIERSRYASLESRIAIAEPDAAMRAFVADALLQPFAEAAASHLRPARPETGSGCPACGSAPVVAVLREEGHGARRSIVCGLCLTEWPTGRIACLACGETAFESLAVFRADELSAARVDACDTCQTYVKTIDLTKDGTAIPIVDDIATLTLDLWAREQGYRRLRPNLLRT